MSTEPQVRYFLGANSPGGFYSLYDQLIDPAEADAVFILKGGPGCGKSTLMKRVAAAAEERGLQVEYIRCSGDPDSLDAILLPEKKMCIRDRVQGGHIGADALVFLRGELAVGGVEDHHRQGAVLLAQGQNPTQVGQILPVDSVRLHLSLEGAVGDLLEHPLHGGVALELVGPFGGQGPQGALHGELFPAAVVEVQVKEQAGTQLGLRGLKNGVELVGGKGHIAHIDLAVVLVALAVEGGGLDEHHLLRLGFEGLSEVQMCIRDRLSFKKAPPSWQSIFKGVKEHVAGQL